MTFRTPLRITLLYCILAIIWLQLIDWLMFQLFPAHQIVVIHILKGLAFVILSAVFLYLLLRRQFNTLEEKIATHQQSAEFLQLQAMVLNQIQDCVTVTDLAGNITYVNEAECRLMQRPREALLGANVKAYGENPAQGATQQQIIDSTLAVGEWRGEIINYAVDGSPIIFDCRTRLVTNETGEPVALCGVSTDITSQRQIENKLQHTTHTLQILLKASPLAILYLDRAGTLEYWNRAAEELFGWRTAEVIGRKLPVIPPDRQSEFEVVLTRLRAGEQIEPFDTVRRRKDGSLVEVTINTAPMLDDDGDLIGTMAIIEDITAQKGLAAENERLTEQFHQSQKLEAIGQLAGGIAHDLNNLLIPIIGYTDLGLMKIPPDHDLYPDLESIKQAGERAAGLTRQILAFSRRQVLTMKALNLNEVISDFQKMLERLISEDIVLTTESAPDIAWVEGDQGQLEQVLLNLVVNARDAMPGGGHLTIKTANVNLDDSFVAAHPGAETGPYVLVSVSDTGHGMDTDTQRHIFEPFFTTKEKGRGSGLGLATVFGIVKQHKGNIWVNSEPGRGTTFEVYLPVSGSPVVKSEDDKRAAATGMGTETALVVEDDPDVRRLTCNVLRAYGYQVLDVETPAEALVLATTRTDPVQMLITDVVMPGMNGRELYEQMSEARPGLKVLYMSGYTDNIIAASGVLGAGCAFLQKPFTVQELLQKVRSVLQ